MDVKRWVMCGLTAGLICAASALPAAGLTDYGPVTNAGSGVQRPGTVVWMDLLTPDVRRAARFYSAVLGWKFEFSPEGDYAYGTLNGEPVASIVELRDDLEKAKGLWLPSIAVRDLKAAMNAVYSDGGSVLQGPEELPGRGRYALVEDPFGAVFMVLRAVTGDPRRSEVDGRWVWNELWTNDVDAAAGFYQSVFDYRLVSVTDGAGGVYRVMGRERTPLAGVVKLPLPKVEPTWLGYLQVEDVDATARQVLKAGGAVLVPPRRGGLNEDIAIVADPTGGVFALQQKEAP